MKRLAAAILLLSALGLIFTHPAGTHAQTVTVLPQLVQVLGDHTQCPAVSGSFTVHCFAVDGYWQSLKGAAYVQIGGASAVTINGKTGTSFTIAATATAPVVTASSTTPTISVSVN